MTTRRNSTVAGFGRPESGKSTFLRERWSSQAPKLISLDTTGETKERNPNAIEAAGFSRLMDVLEIAEGYGRWHIAAILEPDEVEELFSVLAPAPGASTPPLAEAFGGLAIECDEVAEYMTVSGTPQTIKSGLRRARHCGFDWYFATQRPASCAVEVRAFAQIIFAFQQGSPHDLDAIGESISEPVADRIAILPAYHCIYWDRRTGEAVELDAARHIIGTVDTMGVRARRAHAASGIA